jgi:hypothetical protein
MTPRTREKLETAANFAIDMALPVSVFVVLLSHLWPW